MVTATKVHNVAKANDIDLSVELLCGSKAGMTKVFIGDIWYKVNSITNLWDISGDVSHGIPSLYMKFRAVLEDGHEIILSHNIMDQQWTRVPVANESISLPSDVC